MIAIVDYGISNLRSVEKGFERFGFTVKVTDNPKDLKDAKKVVLPGVGAFQDAMEGLMQRNLVNPIKDCIRPASRSLAFSSACNCCFQRAMKMENMTAWTLYRARWCGLIFRKTKRTGN